MGPRTSNLGDSNLEPRASGLELGPRTSGLDLELEPGRSAAGASVWVLGAWPRGDGCGEPRLQRRSSPRGPRFEARDPQRRVSRFEDRDPSPRGSRPEFEDRDPRLLGSSPSSRTETPLRSGGAATSKGTGAGTGGRDHSRRWYDFTCARGKLLVGSSMMDMRYQQFADSVETKAWE